jgi:hypothetical protein
LNDGVELEDGNIGVGVDIGNAYNHEGVLTFSLTIQMMRADSERQTADLVA